MMRYLLALGAMATLQAQECKIAIDIGHSPSQPGATSARGVPEYNFNRRAALYTYHALQKAGIEAFFVNDEEKEISLTQRVTEAEEYGATHFVSFHHDSVKECLLSKWVYNGKSRYYCDKYSGYSLFVSKKNPFFNDSKKLAESIGRHYREIGLNPSHHHSEDAPGERKPFIDQETGVYRYDNLVVLKEAKMPAVLIECGIILNREDEKSVWEEPYLSKISFGVTGALLEQCR